MALVSASTQSDIAATLPTSKIDIKPAYLAASSMNPKELHSENTRLRKQANRLEQILQVMPAGVVVIDGKGIVKQANKLARDLLGEPLDEMLWRTIIQRSFNPQKDDGHEVSLRDGRMVKLSITPLVGEAGQLIVLTDLTETRQLQQRVSHMQRLSSLGKTVASLVHQIRTPLSAAILYAANLTNRNLNENDKQRFSEKLKSRLGDLESQVNDMLLFAKSGEQPVVSPCEIMTVLTEVRQGAEAMLVKHNASLKIELQERSLTVLGNQSALVGALQNLIHNALQIKPEQAKLLIKVYSDRNAREMLIIDVVDDGPGVPETHLSRVFEPFYTTKSQGTGLGLAVVSAVAKSHGGLACVTNNQNGGACFSLRLPKLEVQKTNVYQPSLFSKQLATNGENS